jgi:tetratricopeptide (TPR) repeat protein
MNPFDDKNLTQQFSGLNLLTRPLPLDVAREVVRVFLHQTDLDVPSSGAAIADPSHYAAKPTDFTVAPRIRFVVPVPGEHPLTEGLRWLDARAVFYESLGRFDISRAVRQRMITLSEIIAGKTSQEVLTPLLGLATLEIRMGEFKSADQLLNRATNLAKEMGSSAIFQMASVLHQRGKGLARMGLYRGATKAITRAIDLLKADPTSSESNLAILEEDLAVVYLKAHQSDLAKPVLECVLAKISQARLESLPPERQDGIASYFVVLGKFDEAAKLSARAVDRLREETGEWTPQYARLLSNKGSTHRMRGEWLEAKRDFLRAAQIRRVVLGRDHPDVGQTLMRLALTQAARGAHEEAFGAIKEALVISNQLIGDLNSLTSSNDRLAILTEMRSQLNIAIGIVTQFFVNSPDIVSEAYGMVLRRKAIAFEALVIQRNAILSGRYPPLQDKLRELDALRVEVVRATLAERSDESGPNHLQTIERARDRRDELERELAREMPEMRLEATLDKTNSQAIAACLPPESRLIEFFVFEPPNFEAVLAKDEREFHNACYVAFLVDGGNSTAVRLIKIADESELDDLISRATAEIISDELEASQNIKALGRILDPVFESAPKRLFIAPDGNLSLLAFDLLPDATGHRVLIDGHEITYLGTGRELLYASDARACPMTGAVVVADPNFDAPTGGQSANIEPTPDQGLVRSSESIKDQLGRFERLPGSAAEGRAVASLVPESTLLTSSDATTSAVRTLRRPILLHLATHGFVLDPETSTDPYRDDESEAMTSSGLAMAGANAPHLSTEIDSGDKGILTAGEIATLDLLGTELVVLSACDTGAGVVLRGEGVFGLRRAFRIAGARSVVMTLWPISDDETTEFMAMFYKRLMAGRPKSSALREAKLEFRERHPSPWLWGGFVCEGDRGPIRWHDKAS